MNVAVMRSVVIACMTIVAVVLLIVLVPSVSAGGSGVLDACVNGGNGMMRLVDSSATCHANESFVEWNIQGPQGPQGPAGPQPIVVGSDFQFSGFHNLPCSLVPK